MKRGVSRLLFVSALSMLSLPLFAGAAQERELNEFLTLKRGGQSQSPGEDSGDVTQTVDGQFIEFSRGELTIRAPLDFGLGNASQIIQLLTGGLTKEQIAGKWLVSQESEYVSFEFEGPTFIMVKTNPPSNAVQPNPLVYTGTYRLDNNVVILNETTQGDNFGAIRITGLPIAAGEMEFYFSPGTESSAEYTETALTAKKTADADSDQTTALCQAWRLVKRDGRETQDTAYEETILFTKAGTYLVTYPDQALGLAQWRWKPNSAESQFEYSWDVNWEEAGVGQIQTLTATSFVVQDKEKVIYEFVPVSY